MLFRILTSCLLLLLINIGFSSCLEQTTPQINPIGNQQHPNPVDPSKTPILRELFIKKVICENKKVYDAAHLWTVRELACRQLPIYFPSPNFMVATLFNPEPSMKFITPSPYYLFPLKPPKRGIFTPSFGNIDRMVLNKECDIVGAIMEYPTFRYTGFSAF